MAVENDMRHRVRTSSFPAPSFHTPSSLTTELQAAALEHSPVATLLLDRYQVVCVANRAAQKLFGSIDTLIGQSFSDFKIDFVNKAGFSKLDCDSVLASLEDRWLGRRDSVSWPSFNVTSRRARSTRTKENDIDETFGTSYVGKPRASPEENLQNDTDSQEMHVDVSIPRMLNNSPNENHDPTKARMTASTFAVQGQPYY